MKRTLTYRPVARESADDVAERVRQVEEVLRGVGVTPRKGKVTLYHATTFVRQRKILREKVLKTAKGAPDTYGVYAGTDPVTVSETYGDGSVVELDVPLRDLRLDDVFPKRAAFFGMHTHNGVYRPLAMRQPAPFAVPEGANYARSDKVLRRLLQRTLKSNTWSAPVSVRGLVFRGGDKAEFDAMLHGNASSNPWWTSHAAMALRYAQAARNPVLMVARTENNWVKATVGDPKGVEASAKRRSDIVAAFSVASGTLTRLSMGSGIAAPFERIPAHLVRVKASKRAKAHMRRVQ